MGVVVTIMLIIIWALEKMAMTIILPTVVVATIDAVPAPLTAVPVVHPFRHLLSPKHLRTKSKYHQIRKSVLLAKEIKPLLR